MIRAFIGLPLPEPLVLTCLSVQGHTRSGRPVPRENLHLTLVYLGELPVSDLEDLAADLDRIRHGPVPFRLTGIDVFGAGRDSRLLVATVAPDPAMTELQARIVRTARSAGLDLERRRFRPHVTLVRDFRGRDLPPWTGQAVQALATGFTLYRSTLKKTGAEYDSLADYPLTI